MRVLLILFQFGFLFGLFGACNQSQEIEQLDNEGHTILENFQGLDPKSTLRIAGEKEPGVRLRLCLTIINASSKIPIADQKVLMYHTTSEGDYEPITPNDESTARLSGTVITDPYGRIFVDTILPGDYGSSDDNRHIHTTVFGAKPEGYDIHFKQYSGFMGRRFVRGSDQHFLADLKMDDQGNLIAILRIECKY